MKIVHSGLKYKILSELVNMNLSQNNRNKSANEGSDYVFNILKNHISSEIFFLYLDSCRKEFYTKYKFENNEPFIKGYIESRYFILRKFNISYKFFFNLSCKKTPVISENTGKEIKYA